MRNKKRIAIILLITILIPSFSFFLSVKASNLTYGYSKVPEYSINETKWEQDKSLYNIPADVQYKNTNGLKFNLRLWYERGLKVYGNYKSFPDGSNRFKKNSVEPSLNPNGPYYK